VPFKLIFKTLFESCISIARFGPLDERQARLFSGTKNPEKNSAIHYVGFSEKSSVHFTLSEGQAKKADRLNENISTRRGRSTGKSTGVPWTEKMQADRRCSDFPGERK
jgi:hypothetical protein